MDIFNFISQNKEVILYIAGPLGAYKVINGLKNWLELKQHEWVLRSLSILFSVAAAVLPALAGWLGKNPGALGAHTAEFFMITELMYQGSKSGGKQITKIQGWNAKVKAFDAAAAPETTIGPSPVATIVPSVAATDEYDG